MITLDQVRTYVRQRFEEQDVDDRISDRGFAYAIDTQPRGYLDTHDFRRMTVGNGPIVVVKESGKVYSFSSSPLHMFGPDGHGIGVNMATTAEEFRAALAELGAGNADAVPADDRIG